MEKFAQKWAIIALLEKVTDGYQFHYTNFPLHVTLAGVFKVDLDGNELASQLQRLMTQQSAIDIVADKKALFGQNHDVKVMKMEKTESIVSLHNTINT